jgi:hypothetical protein
VAVGGRGNDGEPGIRGTEDALSRVGGGASCQPGNAAGCHPTGGLDLLLEQQVKRLKDAFEASRTAAVVPIDAWLNSVG